MRTYTYAIESIRTGTVTVTVPDDKTLEEVWLEAMNLLAEHNLNELPGISMDSEEDVTVCEIPDGPSVPRTQDFLIV